MTDFRKKEKKEKEDSGRSTLLQKHTSEGYLTNSLHGTTQVMYSEKLPFSVSRNISFPVDTFFLISP